MPLNLHVQLQTYKSSYLTEYSSMLNYNPTPIFKKKSQILKMSVYNPLEGFAILLPAYSPN